MKSRSFSESNYKAMFVGGKTFRFAINPDKPISPLEYPEFSDVKITSFCMGRCPYCYQDSDLESSHSDKLLEKIKDFYGPMTQNQRPFQVAIGGGEPTSHPDFVKVLELFASLGIVPNYTTNGMFSLNMPYDERETLYNMTKKVSGGVAVSCHDHLEMYWKFAVERFVERNIKTNLHIIISDEKSVIQFREIYDEYKDSVDHFVLLPYQVMGRATQKTIDYEALKRHSPENTDKIAFGADFYPYLVSDPGPFNVSLYEPEIFSSYIDFTFDEPKVFYSSFDLREKVFA